MFPIKKKIIYLPPEQITPYKNNPRLNDNAVPYVMESIEKFGFKVPIILDRNNVIVTGHTRYKAALKLGLKEIPCILADDLTDEQIKAFRLADNKTAEFAEWDFDLLNQELAELETDMGEFGFYSIIDDEEFDHLFEPQNEVQTVRKQDNAPPVQPENEHQPPEDTIAEETDTEEPAPGMFRIIVTLDSAEAMQEMIERLNNEGYDAREW